MNRREKISSLEEKDNLIEFNDQKLVELSQQGNQRAFAVLYNKYRPEIIRVAQKKAGRGISDFGETVAQDVFLKAWAGIGEFRGEKTKFRTWLWNIFNNHLIDANRKRKHRSIMTSYDEKKGDDERPALDKISPEESLPNQERIVAAREMVGKIEEILDNEDPIYKEIYTLSFLKDLKDREIAERLKMPVGTVKSRIRYLKGKVEHLKEAA